LQVKQKILRPARSGERHVHDPIIEGDQMSERTRIDAIMAQVEEMWTHLNALFNIIDETDAWDSPHGVDWTFADVPYHLAYFNLELVARPVELGPDFPENERLSFASVEDVNGWNESHFAARPAGQTGPESLAQVRASWDEIGRVASTMTDDDLDRPYWTPFLGGMWQTAADGLGWSLGHDCGEFMQLRIHMGRQEPVPSAEITNYYLNGMISGIFPLFLDEEAAQDQTFTTIYDFTDPGVDALTMRVADGVVKVEPGRSEKVDLVITQSAEAFEKTVRGIQTVPEAIQSGEVQVSSMEALARFGQLFPMDM
jgi:hypothetical protein